MRRGEDKGMARVRARTEGREEKEEGQELEGRGPEVKSRRLGITAPTGLLHP